MMTENLNIKIKVDTSDVNRSVKEVEQKFNNLNDSTTKKVTGASKATSESMRELHNSLDQVRNAQWADIIIDNFDKIKAQVSGVTKQFKVAGSSFKKAGEELRGAIDFKNFDVGDDGWKGYWDSMKIQAKEASTSVRQSLKHMGQGFKEFGGMARTAINSTIGKLAILVTMLASVYALVRNGLSTSLLGKQMNVLAQQAGMSVEAYQEWAFVLGQVGLEVDDMIGAQQTLLEAQMDVREGTEDIVAAFKRLGMAEEDVLKLNQQQLFEKTVKGLQNIENATERATIAQKLLSEDAKNLAPLLNLTSEEVQRLANNYNTLNGAMSERLIQSSNRLQASLGNLRTAWQGLKNTLAEVVLPVIIEVVNWLTKAIAIVNMFLRTVFGLEMGGGSSNSIEDATTSVGGYTESVETATEAVEKLKRTTMGFDELNIVNNPNSGGGSGSGTGAGAGGGMLGGNFAGGATDSLFNADALDMTKWQEFFDKYKTLIQDITTWGLIGVGVGVAVLGALTANIPMVLAGLGLAGIGFAIGNVDDGTFDRLKQKFEDLNLGIVPIAMVGIGAIGAVIALFMGNIPAAIALAAMAGIGLSLGGGEGIKKFIDEYGEEIKDVVAPSLIGIGAVGAVVALMTGNIPVAIACIAAAGVGLVLGSLGSDKMSDVVSKYQGHLNSIFNAAIVALGIVGAVACLLTGNIPGAILFAAMGGVGLYNITTGGNFFDDSIKAIKKMWDGLKTWFNEKVKPIFTKEWWSKKWDQITEGTKQGMNNIGEAIFGQIGWAKIKIWFQQNVAPIFTKQYWSDKWSHIKTSTTEKMGEIKTSMSTKWGEIKAWWNSDGKKVFTKDYWNTKWNEVKTSTSTKMGEIKTTMGTKWGEIKTWWSTNISKIFTISWWNQKWLQVKEGAKSGMNSIGEAIFGQIGWVSFKQKFNTHIAPKFTKEFWSNKFSSIKDGAKAAFNGVIDVVERAINRIVNKANTLSWEIPDWVPVVGGETFGFDLNTVHIPRLAEGGIVTRSTLANIGENGREGILPLENNTEWMDVLADKIASRNAGPTKLVLKVGEKELGWATIKGINQITKQTGELQLIL